MPLKPLRVLFVCMGNICRSPTAEGVFRRFVEKRGLKERFVIDSAGTIGYHAGQPADSRMRHAAMLRGYDLCGVARQFVAADFERYDLIVAMDRDNRREIMKLDRAGKYRERVKLFCEFVLDPPSEDVPDPYYGGTQGFETVLDLIESGCGPLLAFMIVENDPDAKA